MNGTCSGQRRTLDGAAAAIKAVRPRTGRVRAAGLAHVDDTDAITGGEELYESELSERNKLESATDRQTDGRVERRRSVRRRCGADRNCAALFPGLGDGA